MDFFATVTFTDTEELHLKPDKRKLAIKFHALNAPRTGCILSIQNTRVINKVFK